jgi:hypothetical protein
MAGENFSKKKQIPRPVTDIKYSCAAIHEIFFIPIHPDHFLKNLLNLNRSGGLVFAIPGIFRAIAHIRPNRSRLFDFRIL